MQNKMLVVSPPTVAGAHALPAVLRGDEVRPCCGVVTHSPLPHNHSIPATPRWTTSAHTTIMLQSQDVQTQHIFYGRKDSGEALSRHGLDGAILSSPDQKDLHVDGVWLLLQAGDVQLLSGDVQLQAQAALEASPVIRHELFHRKSSQLQCEALIQIVLSGSPNMDLHSCPDAKFPIGHAHVQVVQAWIQVLLHHDLPIHCVHREQALVQAIRNQFVRQDVLGILVCGVQLADDTLRERPTRGGDENL